MRIYNLLVLLATLILLGGCATSKWKESLASTGNIDDAINNVITDFSQTSSLMKSDSVFNVSIVDNIGDILIIGIARPSDIVRPSYKNKVGTYDSVFPTKYILKEGCLFYWNDSTQIITQEVIDVLKRYDYIDFSWTELSYEMIHSVHDDGVEGFVYYICRNNYKNYKKLG